jgi:hypothetical protein
MLNVIDIFPTHITNFVAQQLYSWISCENAGDVCNFLCPNLMKEIPKRTITVTSFFNEISTDQLGNRVKVRGWGVNTPSPPLYTTAAYWQIFKDDVTGFPPSLYLLNAKPLYEWLMFKYLMRTSVAQSSSVIFTSCL